MVKLPLSLKRSKLLRLQILEVWAAPEWPSSPAMGAALGALANPGKSWVLVTRENRWVGGLYSGSMYTLVTALDGTYKPPHASWTSFPSQVPFFVERVASTPVPPYNDGVPSWRGNPGGTYVVYYLQGATRTYVAHFHVHTRSTPVRGNDIHLSAAAGAALVANGPYRMGVDFNLAVWMTNGGNHRQVLRVTPIAAAAPAPPPPVAAAPVPAPAAPAPAPAAPEPTPAALAAAPESPVSGAAPAPKRHKPEQPQPIDLTESPPDSSPAVPPPPAADEEEEWTCDVCTLLNDPDFLMCDACGTPKTTN